jgi:hypothetical protein
LRVGLRESVALPLGEKNCTDFSKKPLQREKNSVYFLNVLCELSSGSDKKNFAVNGKKLLQFASY